MDVVIGFIWGAGVALMLLAGKIKLGFAICCAGWAVLGLGILFGGKK